MKELSIEEKAKAYDEALAKAAKIHRNYKGRVRAVDVVIEEVFPELKESEDDRIRKELLEHCKNQAKPYIQTGNKCPQIQSWIDWLEKQGEQKIKTPEESLGIDSETYNKIVDECIYGEQNPAWSEEDENRINRLVAYFEDKESFTAEDDIVYANWLKSLKDRFILQPKQE